MFESAKRNRILAATMTLAALTMAAVAENRLSVTRQASNQISIEFQNSEPVSGIQFSVNARGNIKFAALAAGARTTSQGWELYPYQKDDSTWNVVMLSPFRKPLESGKGALVQIDFLKDNDKSADSNIVFLSRTEIVDPQAQILSLVVGRLAWSMNDGEQTVLFALAQNFPNPFNPTTSLSYRLDRPAQVRLTIYDITGREVKNLVSQYQFEGQYTISWESTDNAGIRVPSGTYFARLQVENESAMRKMVLMK
ncbi:MAG: T9SS type A sorting domain-containing protein [Ignavibacteriales bacterium]|nr:T9SS type A sorting domain-containing protein [Ignavibacteriales bacterium]